ncbi:MAG: hypothetical protein KJN93_09130, partial [Alphaproteobacteria bacterium]|nr:hypothetical protein [Alphaproteobacteria bacterium]
MAAERRDADRPAGTDGGLCHPDHQFLAYQLSPYTLGCGIAAALKACGVSHVFGIPGVHNIELYRGIGAAGLEHVLARHEQGAGFMADGYARATGRPGVAFVISGPGVTNIMTPMGQAYSDGVPLLVISSCVDGEQTGKVLGRLHEMKDQRGAAAAVCDWSCAARDAGEAYGLIARAFYEFETGPPRPKHIQIPIEALAAAAPFPPPAEAPNHIEKPDVDGIAAMLTAARRPLFIFGGGAADAARAARTVMT